MVWFSLSLCGKLHPWVQQTVLPVRSYLLLRVCACVRIEDNAFCLSVFRPWNRFILANAFSLHHWAIALVCVCVCAWGRDSDSVIMSYCRPPLCVFQGFLLSNAANLCTFHSEHVAWWMVCSHWAAQLNPCVIQQVAQSYDLSLSELFLGSALNVYFKIVSS